MMRAFNNVAAVYARRIDLPSLVPKLHLGTKEMSPTVIDRRYTKLP